MPAPAVERRRRGRDHPRDVPARVDDRIPFAARERVEIAVAVARDPLHLPGEEVGVRAAAVEDRDSVALPEGGLDQVAAEEPRTSEDEQPHLGRALHHAFAIPSSAPGSTETASVSAAIHSPCSANALVTSPSRSG